MSNPERLPSRSEEGDLHVVIDTPKGSHNKYKWDEELAAFRLARVMPAGMASLRSTFVPLKGAVNPIPIRYCVKVLMLWPLSLRICSSTLRW